MQCTSCGGRLTGAMNICPFCGVRQDIDLRQVDFRDHGPAHGIPCPDCGAGLASLELATKPVMHLERCVSCHGMFFNPGELEYLLELQTHPVVRFDPAQLDQIAADFGAAEKTRYRKCPVCADLMNRENFGGISGVIVDHCRTHGLWLDGGELRRIAEWWRAGGKFLHQENEAKKVERLRRPIPELPVTNHAGTIESPPYEDRREGTLPPIIGVADVLETLVNLLT